MGSDNMCHNFSVKIICIKELYTPRPVLRLPKYLAPAPCLFGLPIYACSTHTARSTPSGLDKRGRFFMLYNVFLNGYLI